MDIDEQILISEVARKRMTTSGDRETDEFLRRQKQIPAKLDANNPDEYKKWLRKKLIDPEFVMLISPILRKLEFNFGGL